jgi:hypothetical protein
MHEELRVEKGFLNEIYNGKGATTPSKMVWSKCPNDMQAWQVLKHFQLKFRRNCAYKRFDEIF